MRYLRNRIAADSISEIFISFKAHAGARAYGARISQKAMLLAEKHCFSPVACYMFLLLYINIEGWKESPL